MRRTGLSRSTIAAWIAWLRRAGLLGTVAHGSTPRYRRGPDDGMGNIAAEYVLAEPQAEPEGEQVSESVGKTRTPSRFSKETLFSPSRAREKNRAVEPVTDRSWPRTATPGTRRDMLKAAERARAESLTLRRLSARHVRSLLRPVWRLGGTVADALYMLDHAPDGRPWAYAGMPRYVAGWVRHRLSAWLTEDGQLRPGVMLPSQRRAAEAAARRAEQERVRAERAELESRRAKDVKSLASRARAILAASSSRAANALRRRALGIA